MIAHQIGPIASSTKKGVIAKKSFALGSWAVGDFTVNQRSGNLEYADSQSLLVSAGQNNNQTSAGRPAFLTSINGGVSWTARYLTNTTSIYGFIYVPNFNKWFAGTTTTSDYITSVDGASWVESSLTNWRGGDFAYSPELNRLVSVGTNWMNYTDDGVTWTSVSVSGSWTSVVWCNSFNTFVAMSTNNITMSSDGGVTWSTPVAHGLNSRADIAWSQELGVLVSAGQNGMRYTKDLITWINCDENTGRWGTAVKWFPELGLFGSSSAGTTTAFVWPNWHWSRDGIHWRDEPLASSDFWFDVEFDLQNGKLITGAYQGSPYNRTDNINTMTCSLLTPMAGPLAVDHVELYPTSIQDAGFENALLTTAWTVEGGATSTTSQTINSVAASPALVGSRFMEAGLSTKKSVVSQLVSLTSAMVAEIDSGIEKIFQFKWAQAGGTTAELDRGHISLIWYDWQHRVVQVNNLPSKNCRAWEYRSFFGVVPASARYYRIEICSYRESGTPLNQYYDDLSIVYSNAFVMAESQNLYAITGPSNNTVSASQQNLYVIKD
jgi:hypothetical protein